MGRYTAILVAGVILTGGCQQEQTGQQSATRADRPPATPPTQAEQGSTWVKVEISGRLERQPGKQIQTDWSKVVARPGDQAFMREDTGVAIVAPGRGDSLEQLGRAGSGPEPNGLGWHLFLGKHRDWHAAAEKLNGKMVRVKGNLVVVQAGGLNSIGGPRLIVVVTSLEAARDRR
jgi:hypothetical protein